MTTARQRSVAQRDVHRDVLLVSLTVLALIAGCADDSSTPTRSGSTPTVTRTDVPTAPTTPARTLSLDPGSHLVVTPTEDAGQLVTLTGTISEGVEAGCLLLESGGVVYQLQGTPARELRAGQPVVVEGRIAKDMLSTCQQGTIFIVTAVR